MSEPRPRMLPMDALFMLGSYGADEGFVQFLVDLRDDGFVLYAPADDALSRDEWEEVGLSRVRTICTAWDIYKERTASSDIGRCPLCGGSGTTASGLPCVDLEAFPERHDGTIGRSETP